MPPSPHPLAPPPAAAAVHTPIERPRSSASAAGVISALPAPWTARRMTSTAGVAARAQPADAAVKSARPATNRRRCPNRSPARPAGISKPPNASVYAVTTHCSVAGPKPRSRSIAGSATATIVVSRTATNWTPQSRAMAMVRAYPSLTGSCDESVSLCQMVERWSWLGEPLAIDFANTVRRHGLEYVEYLDEPGALVEWARREGLRLSARDVGSRLDEVRELRDAVFALLLDATREGGVAAAPGTEARLNAALAAVPLVPQLRGGEVVLTAPRDAPALDELLARVAASALDVLRDPGLALCDAPSCGQFFLRHRGGQRWCGPACGTRARVARHAAHHR